MLAYSLLTVALAAGPALAAAPTPADDGVAIEIGVKVEMPVAYVTGTVMDHAVWSRVPDPGAIELALTQYNVDIGDADVVSVENVKTGGKRIQWLDLGTGVTESMAEGRGKRVCTPTSRGGLWRGAEEIRVFPASVGGTDQVRERPALIVVEDHPTIGALVAVTPGDIVTVRDVRRRGVLMWEKVTVTRPTGELTLERNELRERLCWEAPEQSGG